MSRTTVTAAPPGAGPSAQRGRLSSSVNAVLLVGAVTLVLRAPSLLEPQHYADEGIFAAVAQRLLQGHALYTGAWDDKPPLIYWLYAAVIGLFGPSMAALRAVATLWAAMGGAAVTLIGRRLYGPRAGIAAGLVFAVLSSVTFVEGNLALTELFAATPAAWAMFLLAREGRPRIRGCALAGGLFGIAFLFKQVSALDALAAGLYLLLFGRAGAGRAGALAAGWLAPVALVAAILAAEGALGAGMRSVFGFYGGYLGEGSGLPRVFGAAKLLPPGIAIVWAIAGARNRPPRPAHLLAMWVGCACLAATLSGRPYGHYLIQLVAPAALCGVALAGRRPPRAMTATAIAAALVIGGAFSRFWFSFPMVRPSYYVNSVAYAAGLRSRADYESFFYWRVPTQDALAPFIRADGERTLFIWGEFPWLYLLTDAEGPTRFTVSYHTSYVPGAKDEALAAITAHPPRFIVWGRDEWRRLPGLDAFLAGRYERIATVNTTELYRRRDAR